MEAATKAGLNGAVNAASDFAAEEAKGQLGDIMGEQPEALQSLT